jgi:sugar phosphate isomerase/epimerase
MMRLACHTWAYNDKPLDEAIATIARLGFRYVDLGSGSHLNVDNAATRPGQEAEKIKALLEEHHLELTDLYLMLPYINSPDPKSRQAQLTLFERLIPFAIALGTPGITVSPGILQPDGPEHALARSIPALLKMSEIIEDSDIRLCFEPHMDSAVITPAQALQLVEIIPSLSICLDYAHFVVQGYKLNELQKLLPYTAHVHVRQAVKGRLQTGFQQGRIDLKTALHDLKSASYNGVLTVEYMTTVGWHGMMAVNVTQETVKTRDALRDLRAGLN